jgi:hypothetical protein
VSLVVRRRRNGYPQRLPVAKHVCPHCGRKLPVPAQSGTVRCDGCEQSFDPSKVRLRPASMPKRIIGWALLVVGSLLLFGAVSAALRYDLRDHRTAVRLFGTFLLPAVAIFAGFSLKSSRLAVEESAS